MPRVEIAGLPKGYWVGKSHDGKKWILTLPNQDGIYLLAEWDHQPSLKECLEAIDKNESQQIGREGE